MTAAALAVLGASCAIGLSAVGAGFAIGQSGAAMSGAVTERPEAFTKSLIAVVLAEALAIYGLLISFMIIMRLGEIVNADQAYGAFSAGLAIGLAALGAGWGIGQSGAAMSGAVTERPEAFTKSLIAVVLAEALAIYGLLISFMIIMQI